MFNKCIRKNEKQAFFPPPPANKLRVNFVNLKKKKTKSILSYWLKEGQWKIDQPGGTGS